MNNKYNEENLINTVKKCKTLSEVLLSLGLRCAGGNYKTLKKYIQIYNINTAHFDEHHNKLKYLKEYNFKIKKPLDSVLTENSTYNRGDLKRRLLSEGYLDYVCNNCGNDGEWCGKPLTLQLEHKNGIYNDNRIENLELLCPNCHSQTKTFAGKNINKTDNVEKKKYSDEQINSFKNRRLVERPSYEELNRLINDLGYNGTGRMFNVTDNTIRKWVKFYKKEQCPLG